MVGAYDAEMARDAEVAQLAVPIKDPVNEPVLICAELDTNPAGKVTEMDAVLLATLAVRLLSNDSSCAVPRGVKSSATCTATPAAITPDNPDPSPENDPVNEPVLICVELDTRPAGLLVTVDQSAAAPATYPAVTA